MIFEWWQFHKFDQPGKFNGLVVAMFAMTKSIDNGIFTCVVDFVLSTSFATEVIVLIIFDLGLVP